MANESCTLFCRNGSAKYDPKTLQEMGCQKIDTPAGVVLQCPTSCSTMIHAVRAQGPPVKVSEPVAIATYTHHGASFRGYITYDNQQPDHSQLFASSNNGAKEILHNDARIFRLTKERSHPGLQHPAPHQALPDVFTIAADETGPLFGRKFPFDGTVKYGAPYKIFTSWNFLPAPNTLISRRQEMDRLLPTTDSVMCMYTGRNRSRDIQGKVECAYDNSRWVFVPADGATEDGETLYKDDMFYISEYPGIGKSRFLKWNDETSNFDLVQKSEASVFAFPSSPVDQGPNHSTCQYVPGYITSNQPPVMPLQDDSSVQIDVRDNAQGDQMIYQPGPGPMPLPLPLPPRYGPAGGYGYTPGPIIVQPAPQPSPQPPHPAPAHKPAGGPLQMLMIIGAIFIGIFVVMFLRGKMGCKDHNGAAAAASAMTSALNGSSVRIVP